MDPAPHLPSSSLTPEEESIYAWQLDVPGLGEEGQSRLKSATVLVSRVGGLGGAAAWSLAAAGVGKLILAHAGSIKPSDLNRQTLMTQAGLGRSRVESAAERLRAFNPRLDIEAIPENISPDNVESLAQRADVIIDAAPLFSERYALNKACVHLGKPMIECAVHELELHLTTIIPGRTPCLRCLYPQPNPHWTRRFPVLGAVSATAGSLAAMEAIKVLTGLGRPLAGKLLVGDLRGMSWKSLRIHRVAGCADCGNLGKLGGA
ncbi:MAG: HesA/MoeB/ThiF family protein [Verrucomicrobia bacterium]|nr:HesA/MoeB/ThiF family protein [Verrucomicrobiota bacterium]